jgi:polysaccharide pyruvyl transferase WcaK-like protein
LAESQDLSPGAFTFDPVWGGPPAGERVTDSATNDEFAGGVALLSPSGWGNLGDAAILDSVIHAVRTRLPGAPLLALTLNPRDSAARHGIPALTCTGLPRPHYGVAENGPELALATDVDVPEHVPPARWRQALATPLAVWSISRGLGNEARHRRRLRAPTAHLRMIVVAGGGQIDDFWGGAFGHPYVLWRWAEHARATGAKFSVLSVGTGALTTRLARLFAVRALSKASYRSFRDEGSRALVPSSLVAGDPIVPDLAYGFPIEQFQIAAPIAGERTLVAISPIAYGDERSWPTPDASKYRRYIERLASVAVGLLRSNHDLVLFGTDTPDLFSVQDLKAEVAKQVSAAELERVRVPLVRTVKQLMAALSGVQALVASRLHGVLLTQLAAIPVVALSYERKVETHMRSLDQERLCLPIEQFEAARVLSLLREVGERRAEICEDIRRVTSERRRQVEQQYDTVFK